MALQALSAGAEAAQAAEARAQRLLVKASGQASEAVSLSPSEGERSKHQQRSPPQRAVHQESNSGLKTVKRNGFK